MKVDESHPETVYKYRNRKRLEKAQLKVDDVWHRKSVQNAGKPKPITEKTIFDFKPKLPHGQKISRKNNK